MMRFILDNLDVRQRWHRASGILSSALGLLFLSVLGGSPVLAQGAGQKWAASWSTSIQSAFALPTTPQAATAPAYNPQPDLSFALPNATSQGANNQTFRMLIKPDLWGSTVRIKLSNFFGTQAVTFSAATVGLQSYQAVITPGSMSPITFGGSSTFTIPAGSSLFSDPIQLNFVNSTNLPLLRGRNLAVSFAVSGTSGPLSYHDAAFATSYISAPNSGDLTQDPNGVYFPYTTTSTFLVSELDVIAPSNTIVICAFGDSITDGTFSTINGDDRWLNFMSNILHTRFGDRISVVNEAIAGNAIISQVTGQPAVQRVGRDVVSLSGLNVVIMLEGINDLGSAGVTNLQLLMNGYGQVAASIHNSGVYLIGATITPSATPGYTAPSNSPLAALSPGLAVAYGSAQTDQNRLTLNRFIMSVAGVFDGVADFAAATRDPATGTLYASFVPNSEGTAGDYLHPNRAGYINMGFVAADAIAKFEQLH